MQSNLLRVAFLFYLCYTRNINYERLYMKDELKRKHE